MTNQTKSQKILNGCLNWVRRTKEGINLYCGDTYQTLKKTEKIRCETCLAKAQQRLEDLKDEREFLDTLDQNYMLPDDAQDIENRLSQLNSEIKDLESLK